MRKLRFSRRDKPAHRGAAREVRREASRCGQHSQAKVRANTMPNVDRSRVYDSLPEECLEGGDGPHDSPSFRHVRTRALQDFVLYFCIPAYNEAPTVGLLIW